MIEEDFINTYEFSEHGFVFREFLALLFSVLYKIERGFVVDPKTNSIIKDINWHVIIPVAHIESDIELMILFREIDKKIEKANDNIEISNLHNLAAQTLTDLDEVLEEREIPEEFNSEVVLTVLVQEIIEHLELASKSK